MLSASVHCQMILERDYTRGLEDLYSISMKNYNIAF